MDEQVINLLTEIKTEIGDLRLRLDRIEQFLASGALAGGAAGVSAAPLPKIPVNTSIQLEHDVVVKGLSYMAPYVADVYLFREFYLSSGRESPIRRVGKKVEYWTGEGWQESDKRQLGKMISDRIKMCYMKHTKSDEIGFEAAKAIQSRLTKMGEPKYCAELCEKVLDAAVSPV